VQERAYLQVLQRERRQLVVDVLRDGVAQLLELEERCAGGGDGRSEAVRRAEEAEGERGERARGSDGKNTLRAQSRLCSFFMAEDTK